MNPILHSELQSFKQDWCDRWMASWKIQRWWKRKKFEMIPLIREYIQQVKTNYCHQLELLFYTIDIRDKTGDSLIYIPVYLYSIPKIKELITELTKKSKQYIFKIILGLGPQYHEDYINCYVAQNVLVDIPDFRKLSPEDNYIRDKIIFISRQGSKKRRIENEHELIKILQHKIPEMEIHSLDEESSAVEQAKLFSRCKVLIGLHGAGLANLLWMHSSAYIYEITPKGHFYHNYREKAHFRGLTHRYIEIEKYEKSEKSLVYPRDSILHISEEEMREMGEVMERDGIAQKLKEEYPKFTGKLVSNNIKISDEIDEATRRKIVKIPFNSSWLKELEE